MSTKPREQPEWSPCRVFSTCQCAGADPVAVLARLGGGEDVARRALGAVAALDAGHAPALPGQLVALPGGNSVGMIWLEKQHEVPILLSYMS